MQLYNKCKVLYAHSSNKSQKLTKMFNISFEEKVTILA